MNCLACGNYLGESGLLNFIWKCEVCEFKWMKERHTVSGFTHCARYQYGDRCGSVPIGALCVISWEEI